MREHGKKKEGQRNVIPPQIFNGQEFRGVRCGHCYDQLKLVFQGLRRLWYRQWRWCPWRVPRSGKVKTKGTAIDLLKKGGFNLCKETLYMSTMKILSTSDRTGQNGSSCSRGEQVESWQTRPQGGGKVKQRKRWGIWCDFHSGHPYSFSVFLHICPFSSFIFSLFLTLFLAPYLCFWWRKDKPSRRGGNNRSLQNTCFFRHRFVPQTVLPTCCFVFAVLSFYLPASVRNMQLASCLLLASGKKLLASTR